MVAIAILQWRQIGYHCIMHGIVLEDRECITVQCSVQLAVDDDNIAAFFQTSHLEKMMNAILSETAHDW